MASKPVQLDIQSLYIEDPKVMDIVDQGVEYKRRGDLQGAKQCYLRAIKMNNHCQAAHFALGKISYLLNQPQDAVNAYMDSILIIIQRLLNQLKNQHLTGEDCIELAYAYVKDLGVFKLEGLRSLSSKGNQYSPLVVFHLNALGHLGHAVIDYSGNVDRFAREVFRVEPHELKFWIDDYRKGLSGKPSLQTPEKINFYYTVYGAQYAAELIAQA